MLEALRRADYEQCVSQKFEVHVEGFGPVEIELVEIEDRSTEQMESFSLLFSSDKERVLRQNTYRMTHLAMGEFLLFLGPVVTQKGDESGWVYYEAVINCSKSQ